MTIAGTAFIDSVDARSKVAAAAERTRLLLYTNTPLYGGVMGGMEKHMELLGRYIDRTRFEVYGMCPDLRRVAPLRECLSAVCDHFVALTVDSLHPWNGPKMIGQLRRWGIDVMHVHNGYYLGQTLSVLAGRAGGVQKVFVTEHNAPHHRETTIRQLERRVFARLIDGLVCVSEKNRVLRSQYLETIPGRTFVVENGVDTDEFVPIAEATLAELRAQIRLPSDAQVLGSVVRFEEEKGLKYLVEAMPAIRAACPRAHLLLVGEGSLRQALQEQAEQLGLRGYVHFPGFQSNPRPYYGLLDVFVLPVPVGSMSIALLEAMAMSCPVVMTFGGEGEAVIHEKTGLTAEPRNASSIAERVIRLLRDPEYARRIGRAGRTHIEQQFSARTTARRLEELYLNA